MQAAERKKVLSNSNIILEDREKLHLSGVVDVEMFSEEKLVLETVCGILTITGRDLKIENLNVDSGDLFLFGFVHSLVYSEPTKQKGSFLSRVFG